MKTYLFFLVLLILSCNKDQPKQTEIREADNLREVTNKQPLHKGQFWTFSAEPVLQIGVANGDEPYMFHRLNDATKLPDGRLLASNAGTYQLRYFDAKGNFLRSFGRQGKGPGEFGDYSSMKIFRMGEDSIAINDRANKRMNLFDLNGNLGRTIIVEPIEGAGNPSIIDLFADGSWLVWSTLGSAALEGQPGDLLEKDYLLHRLQRNGDYDSTLISFPNRTKYVHESGGIRNFPYIPLQSDPLYITDNNSLLYATGNDPEIARINKEGFKTAIFRWQMPRTEVSEIWDQHYEDYLASINDNERRKRHKDFLNKDLPLPEKVPAINDIHVDRLGYIWAQRYELSWVDWEKHTGMDILDPDGKWLGTLQLPKKVEIFEIGEDYLLGAKRDKDGVETLVMYNLKRNKNNKDL